MKPHADIASLRTLIVIPTFNERDNLANIIDAIVQEVPFVHILVVDDNSPDGTGDLADELAAGDDRIHVLHRKGKLGLGTAYVAGFRWALERDYERIFEMDADFSHPPRYLPEMLSRSLEYDVVIGSRYVKGGGTEDWGLLRQFISRGGGLYARTILGVNIRDLTAGFICWRRDVLTALPLGEVQASGYAFQIEMKYLAHQRRFRLFEVPITFPDRRVGQSKMSPKIALEALVKVWAMRFRK